MNNKLNLFKLLRKCISKRMQPHFCGVLPLQSCVKKQIQFTELDSRKHFQRLRFDLTAKRAKYSGTFLYLL